MTDASATPRPVAPSTVGEGSWRYRGWRVTGAAGGAVFAAVLAPASFPVLVKPLTAEFQWSREAVSLGYGCLTLGAAVAAPFVGRVYDRVGPKPLCGPALLLATGGFAALPLVGNRLWLLYALLTGIGASIPATSAVVYARAVASWFDARRGRALGVVLACAGLGGVAYPLVATELVAAIGWRRTCTVMGTVAATLALPLAALGVRERSTVHAASPVTGGGVGVALRAPLFWIMLAVVFGSTLALNGVSVHLLALLTDRGLPPATAAAVAACVGGASIAGRVVTGPLLDQMNPFAVGAGLLGAAALGVALLATADSGGLAAAAAMLIGFGTGGELDVVPYVLSRRFGLRSLSTLYGLQWTAWGAAGALGPALMGRAFDSTGAYDSVLVVFALTTLAGAGLLLVARAIEAEGSALEG
jgi:MFS family permease